MWEWILRILMDIKDIKDSVFRSEIGNLLDSSSFV
jgi:hypothetical protein